MWRAGQNAFFDGRITNTHSPSQVCLTTERVLTKHEQEKKRNDNRRIMNIEHGTFIPLFFSLSGCMAKESSIFHKHAAERLAIKLVGGMKISFSFLILKSALMCVRGSRSHNLRTIDEFELVSHFARIE